MDIQKTILDFNNLFYSLSQFTWDNTTYFGYKVWKNPLDMWIMQEIICEVKPDVIIETGTFMGGSAFFYAHILDQLNHGRIITIDITDRPNRPEHERIKYITSNSDNINLIDVLDISTKKVLVILDSDHSTEHVMRELEIYAPLVSIGSYIVVEDTNIGLPLIAVQKFLETNTNFIVDRSREKYLCTFNPSGYLKRVK